jgi:enamine deaminase RidA (YjgF/YER057c/UK114 family)
MCCRIKWIFRLKTVKLCDRNIKEKWMMISKDAKGLGMPWEDEYGYAQAIKVGDTIYLSGQLSHDDEGNFIGPAPLDDQGRIQDHSNMEIQMRQTYVNAKKLLAQYGATLDNVVEEVVYVTDMDTAMAAAGPVRKEAYGSEKPQVASTILVTPRLALPPQLIEIKFLAKV